MWHAKAKLTHIIKDCASYLEQVWKRFHSHRGISSCIWPSVSLSVRYDHVRMLHHHESGYWGGRAAGSVTEISEVSFREKWAWFSRLSIYTKLQANNTMGSRLLICIKLSAKMPVSCLSLFYVIIFYKCLFRRVLLYTALENRRYPPTPSVIFNSGHSILNVDYSFSLHIFDKYKV